MNYFGFYLGRGTIHMDGSKLTIEMTKKACFGTDSVDVRGVDCITSKMYDNDPDKLTSLKFQSAIGIRV